NTFSSLCLVAYVVLPISPVRGAYRSAEHEPFGDSINHCGGGVGTGFRPARATAVRAAAPDCAAAIVVFADIFDGAGCSGAGAGPRRVGPSALSCRRPARHQTSWNPLRADASRANHRSAVRRTGDLR